jgi:hypothetical protein
VLVLDRDGRRLYLAAPRSRELRLAARLEVDTPSSVAAASEGVAYVAHPRGLLRVDLGSRATRPVTAAKGVDLSGLAWIRWHRGSIVAVQSTPDAGYRIVRIALDGAGRTARRLTLLHHAVPMSNPSAAALSGDVLYYLTGSPHGEPAGAVETIVRRVTVW